MIKSPVKITKIKIKKPSNNVSEMLKKFSSQEAPKKEIIKPKEQKETEPIKKHNSISDRLKLFSNNGAKDPPKPNNLVNKQDLEIFDGKREFFLNSIDEKARNIEDDVGSSITKMDAEIQKSLSHQKAEYSRLDQQINQLKVDENIIKNQLLIVQKRIDDIQLQIGQKF